MKGQNVVTINRQTLAAALELYFNTHVFQEDVKVLDIKKASYSTDYEQNEVTIQRASEMAQPETTATETGPLAGDNEKPA